MTSRDYDQMNLAALPAIIVSIAERRSLTSVLMAIIEAVRQQQDVALARIWLRTLDQDRPHCSSGTHQPGYSLHLSASGGTPLKADADWSKTNGTFHRVPLGRSELKLSHMATSGIGPRPAFVGRSHMAPLSRMGA